VRWSPDPYHKTEEDRLATTKKMTKAQALDTLEKRVVKIGEAAFKRIDEGTPKLKASAKKLTEALKSAESPDLIETLMRHLKLQVKPVAEGVALLDEVIKRLKEAENDEEMFELIADDMAEVMKIATDKLEKSRKDLREAKTLTDKAEKALESRGGDSTQAAEEWASTLGEFERVVGGAAKELPAWDAWEKEARAAVDARDKARLARNRKAIPKSELIDTVLGWPKGKPFVAFDKEFKFESLAKDLQDEISRDRAKALLAYNKVLPLAEKKPAIYARVDALEIQPRDAKKALGVLGLPSGALAKLQAALDGPDAARAKALETLAKAHKVELSGKDAIAGLTKAGVL
jgi:hypothetical protein